MKCEESLEMMLEVWAFENHNDVHYEIEIDL